MHLLKKITEETFSWFWHNFLSDISKHIYANLPVVLGLSIYEASFRIFVIIAVFAIAFPFLFNICRFVFRLALNRLRPIRFYIGGYYLGMHAEEGINVTVGSFQATGENFSSKFFDTFSGFLRSVETGETYPMYINIDGDLLAPGETNGIPPRCKFNISVPLQRDRKDISNRKRGFAAEHFLRDIGTFDFVFRYDHNEVRYTLPRNQSKKLIERWREEINRPESLSRITRKTSAEPGFNSA